MKTAIVISFALLVLVAGAQAQQDCPVVCPLLWSPVCGQSETGAPKQFANQCDMKATGCRERVQYQEVDISLCPQ